MQLDKHRQSSNFQFAELNIRHRGDPARTLALVRRAVRMGYDAVAINVDIGRFGASVDGNQQPAADVEGDDGGPPRKKKRKKQQQQKQQKQQQQAEGAEEEIVPDPFLVDEAKLDLAALAAAGRRFRQFSRLTVTLDANCLHRLQHHAKVRRYDLLAVRVPDEQILLTLQRKGEFIDIVSLDATASHSGGGGRVPWLFKQKIVQSCIAAGITFELCYAHALASSEHRRQFFANARRLMEITRGGRAGVVLSSGADEMLQLRGPFDVANLCSLFGLPPKCGRRFVASSARAALLRAQTRRHTVKGAMHMVDLAPGQSADQSADQPSTSRSAFAPGDAALAQLAAIEEFAAEMPSTSFAVEKQQQQQEVEDIQVVESGQNKLVGANTNKKRKRSKMTSAASAAADDEEAEVSESKNDAEDDDGDKLFEIFT